MGSTRGLTYTPLATPKKASNKKARKQEYVVNGAKVECSRGSNPSTLVIPDHGYDVGYGPVGLDTDTAILNFSSIFGKCKITGEVCTLALVERWVEVAECQNVNDGHPLLMKSMVVCTQGAYVSILENGQDMGLTDADKEHLMIMEYRKLHGAWPTPDDLKNPLFLTDLRLGGNGHLLNEEQLEKTNNLFSLAARYPDYYRLDEKYGLGTPEYNAKLEELRSVLEQDFKVMETKEIKKQGQTFTYEVATWPDWKVRDAILNGVVEQAIYEIKGNQAKADAVPNNDWYAFTSTINGVVSDISIHKEDSGDWCGNISQTLHWERNAFNRAPATWDEFIQEVASTQDTEWKAQMIYGSGYHMTTDEDGIWIIKIHRDSGQELIYSLKEGENGAFRPENSTYNYGEQSSGSSAFGTAPHKVYDMTTHNNWLESEAAFRAN